MVDTTPRLDVIIVNWNTGRLLRRCLESIVSALRDGFRLSRVVLIDNASEDRSTDGIEHLDLPLEIIRNPVNRGFGAACNQAAQLSTADYLLLLNPDTRLRQDSLTVPMAFMEESGHEDVGIVGVQLVNDGGQIVRSCARFLTPGMILRRMFGLDRLSFHRLPPHLMSDWDHQDTRVVDHVMGAFFLVRRSLFEALGGFDERFFVYLEDLDFSLRAKQAGWRTVYVSDARVYHAGGGSSGQVRARRLCYALQSRILYMYKHFDSRAATGLTLATLLIEAFTRVVFGAARGSGREVVDTLRGYGMLWFALPTVVKVARSARRA